MAWCRIFFKRKWFDLLTKGGNSFYQKTKIKEHSLFRCKSVRLCYHSFFCYIEFCNGIKCICGETDALLFGDNDDKKDNFDTRWGSDTCIPRESDDAASSRHFDALFWLDEANRRYTGLAAGSRVDASPKKKFLEPNHTVQLPQAGNIVLLDYLIIYFISTDRILLFHSLICSIVFLANSVRRFEPH